MNDLIIGNIYIVKAPFDSNYTFYNRKQMFSDITNNCSLIKHFTSNHKINNCTYITCIEDKYIFKDNNTNLYFNISHNFDDLMLHSLDYKNNRLKNIHNLLKK